MIAMTSISCVVVAFGLVLLMAGLVLVLRRMRLAGTVVALLGIGLITIPILTFLYVAWAMR